MKNIFSYIQTLAKLSPEILQFLEVLVAAFNALPQQHQQAVSAHAEAVISKYSQK